MWELTLLGSFRLSRAGMAVEGIEGARLQSLLAFLSLRPGKPQERGRLAGLLWPDSSEEQARTNLRKTVHRLRDCLPGAEDLLALKGETLAFREHAAPGVDAVRFRAAARVRTVRSLAGAVGLYGGELLPGLWDEWVLAERELLRAEYGAVLDALAELLESRGEWREADRCLQRLLAEDPLREEPWRRLLRLHGRAGDGAGVEAAWRRCVTVLERELGVEPSPATRRVYEESCSAAREGRPPAGGDGPRPGTLAEHPEEELFVGRREEIALFRAWLREDNGKILNLHGPGGVGKSALLRAFGRTARREGRPVVRVDARDFSHTPEEFLAALGPPAGEDAVAWLNRTRPVLFLDTFEEMEDLSRWLREEFLTGLAPAVRVVLAGRHPLGRIWTPEFPWRYLVRSLPLEGFGIDESREYLGRRGVEDPALREGVARAAGGSPLALSLAADMVLQYDWRGPRPAAFPKDLAAVPAWGLVVRSLVEEFLREAKDPFLRRLLEAAAVVRRFDQDLLAALVGEDAPGRDLAADFRRLVALSAVRPAERGLTLHDEVRRFVAEDLRRHWPERYTGLHLRAVAYHRRLLGSAVLREREWLVAECLFLLNQGLLRTILFQDEPGQVHVTTAAPWDRAALFRVWSEWSGRVLGSNPPPELETHLRRTLENPAIRLRVARDGGGAVLGFTVGVPVCRDTLDLLTTSPTTASLIAARFGPADLAALPATPWESTLFHFRYVAEGNRKGEAARSALIRDLFALFINEGTYFISTPVPSYKEVADLLGFENLPAARNWGNGPGSAVEHYELDLSRTGFDAWYGDLLHRCRPAGDEDRRAAVGGGVF
ncbi:MAG: BTAD domain-containing putative transcriptional regulator [Peptococcaceae bacterium]|jgi:DNA-binding SARP family transcriptional activator|nr:BTAD domain-containing putative transcriptional regulator [Peptococcaceae bacterium]